MPIYEYRCDACNHALEVIQKMSDPPLLECPECGKATLQKQISASGFRLKGGGWYETDFKGGKKKNIHGERGETAKKAPDGASVSVGASASAAASPKGKGEGASAAASPKVKGEGAGSSGNMAK